MHAAPHSNDQWHCSCLPFSTHYLHSIQRTQHFHACQLSTPSSIHSSSLYISAPFYYGVLIPRPLRSAEHCNKPLFRIYLESHSSIKVVVNYSLFCVFDFKTSTVLGKTLKGSIRSLVLVLFTGIKCSLPHIPHGLIGMNSYTHVYMLHLELTKHHCYMLKCWFHFPGRSLYYTPLVLYCQDCHQRLRIRR